MEDVPVSIDNVLIFFHLLGNGERILPIMAKILTYSQRFQMTIPDCHLESLPSAGMRDRVRKYRSGPTRFLPSRAGIGMTLRVNTHPEPATIIP